MKVNREHSPDIAIFREKSEENIEKENNISKFSY